MLPTDPRWTAMTDLEILRESWRWHFYDLLREGQQQPEGVEVNEYIADDDEFEEYVRSMESDVSEKRLQRDAESQGWEPIE